MTRLRIAFPVSGCRGRRLRGPLRLIYGQLTDFGVSAAVCAGSLVVAGLIAHADNRRRQAVARGRAAVWQRRGGAPRMPRTAILAKSISLSRFSGLAPQGRPTITITVTSRPRDDDNWG
jgi:hypothetical protein